MDPLQRIVVYIKKHVAAEQHGHIDALSPGKNGGLTALSKNHLKGIRPGKMVFFVISKTDRGYLIRLGGRRYILQTKKQLSVARAYIGQIQGLKGQLIQMSETFVRLDNTEGLAALLRDYSANTVMMLIRNHIPIKDDLLHKLTDFLKKYRIRKEEEDIVADACEKGVLSEELIPLLGNSQPGEDREFQENGAEQPHSNFMKEIIKNIMLRKEGPETPLLLYNYSLKRKDTHWVHIPYRFFNGSLSVEGYIRIQFDIQGKRMKRLILQSSSDMYPGEKLWEVTNSPTGYRISGLIPEDLRNKLLGSCKRIVDTYNVGSENFTGFSLIPLEEMNGVDVDA